MSTETQTHGFRIETRGRAREQTLCVSGELNFRDASELWLQLRRVARRRGRLSGSTIDLDVGGVTHLDSGAAALLLHTVAELRRRGANVNVINATPEIEEILDLHAIDEKSYFRRRRAPSALDEIGRAAARVLGETKLLFGFIGDLTVASLQVLRRPQLANWRETWPTMERTGADGVPIIGLISFLVGLVSAAQSAAQLERYGANLFVADLVGLSMTRELGPLMTAIVVTGRSGAAFTAEIGAMKVNEEIDALRTIGIAPMPFLVIPRALALLCMLPLLALFSDVLGVLGGLVVGVTRLDLSTAAYMNRIAEAVKPWDIGQGMLKSALFALAIAVISCHQGLAARGSAAAVGQRTTTAVVGMLFSLILIDAVFALAVGVLGR